MSSLGDASTDAAAWIERVRSLAEATAGLDHWEVRADVQQDRRFVRRGGVARAAATKHLGGIGVRAFVGAGVGYAYTNEETDTALRSIVERATDLARANDRSARHGFAPRFEAVRKGIYRPEVRDHPSEVDVHGVYDLLERAEEGIRSVAPDATAQTAFGYKAAAHILADSAGSYVSYDTLHSTLLVQTVLRDSGRIGDGNTWVGGERGVGDYEADGGPYALGEEAGRQAKEQLNATSVPSGRYRALCDNHLSGVMAHESFGHLTEYDLVASGWSVLGDRLGERLANEIVTIRDVPTMDGSKDGVTVPFDEEGTPGRPVTLLERGVLKDFMHTRDSAGDGAPAGNARALNIGHPPIVRMRNTYIEPGELSFEEAVEMVGNGVYLIGGRGGSPRADGSFMFSSQRGYYIENGEITRPLKMASIYGNVLDFLQNVQGLTRERKVYTTYFGGCGKWDQSFLHIGNGGPHVVVEEALVGGQG